MNRLHSYISKNKYWGNFIKYITHNNVYERIERIMELEMTHTALKEHLKRTSNFSERKQILIKLKDLNRILDSLKK